MMRSGHRRMLIAFVWSSAVAFDDLGGSGVRPIDRRNVESIIPPLVRDDAAWKARRLPGATDAAAGSSFSELQSENSATAKVSATSAHTRAGNIYLDNLATTQQSIEEKLTDAGHALEQATKEKEESGPRMEKATELEAQIGELKTALTANVQKNQQTQDNWDEQTNTLAGEQFQMLDKEKEEAIKALGMIGEATKQTVEQKAEEYDQKLKLAGETKAAAVHQNIFKYVSAEKQRIQEEVVQSERDIAAAKQEAVQALAEAEQVLEMSKNSFANDKSKLEKLNEEVAEEVKETQRFIMNAADSAATKNAETAAQERKATTTEMVKSIHEQREMFAQRLMAVEDDAKKSFSEPITALLTSATNNLLGVSGSSTRNTEEAHANMEYGTKGAGGGGH